MPVYKSDNKHGKEIAPGVFRKIAHLEKIMAATIEFTGGPMDQPDKPHSHPHEQVSYVAAGSLYLFLGEEKHLLEEGDLFLVPSNVPHSIQTLSEKVKLVDVFTPLREEFLTD
ncbi:MAG: cupin domain-containing protein [Balneolaceae bacterium]|nr:cupin domain-containing protein [Balneolaceae bacterium]